MSLLVPSLPPGELAQARTFARDLGLRHRSVRTHEVEREAYLANGTVVMVH